MQTKQTDLARLLQGTKVFVVPQFQRHYKWKASQWLELFEDILEQYWSPEVQAGNPSTGEGHFLGSIVLHPAPGPASTVSRFWVIDGQQRLTTLLTLLAALRDVRSANDPGWNPDQYTNQYLCNQYNPDQPHRLVPGDNDRDDFISTVYDKIPAGQIGEGYKWFCRKIDSLRGEADFDYVKFENAVLLRLVIVEINTSDDDNINQIFNTINHSGMRLSATDLIRNHSFMQFDSASAASVYEDIWRPLELSLGTDQRLSQYFWAQLVRSNPKATQRDLYAPFQRRLLDLKRSVGGTNSEIARAELKRLRDEVPLFLALVDENAQQPAWSKELRAAVNDLREWGSSTHIPIALEIVSRVDRGKTDPDDASIALRYLLSFLVRRGLGGVPTNNLNRILSSIPSSLSGGPVAVQLARELVRGNKYWLSDSELRERAVTAQIYQTLQPAQVKFVLAELNDQMMPNEPVERSTLTVEHILPQTVNAEWRAMLESMDVPLETAAARTHVIGNLTVTGQNSALGQLPPSGKAELLRNSSLKINREIAIGTTWTPKSIDERSAMLVELALSIWRRPDLTDETEVDDPAIPVPLPIEFTAGAILDALPADRWIALDDLVSIVGTPRDQVIDEVVEAGYHVDDGSVVGHPAEIIPGMTDLSSFDFDTASQSSVADAVAALESMGSERSGSAS